MVTIWRRSDGTYAVDFATSGPFVVLSVPQLDGLLQAMLQAGMITADGRRLTARQP